MNPEHFLWIRANNIFLSLVIGIGTGQVELIRENAESVIVPLLVATKLSKRGSWQKYSLVLLISNKAHTLLLGQLQRNSPKE